MPDNTSERIDKPTPNGGKYSIAFFYDDAKRPIEKKFATQVEIFEYDENDKVIYRTYGVINQKKND